VSLSLHVVPPVLVLPRAPYLTEWYGAGVMGYCASVSSFINERRSDAGGCTSAISERLPDRGPHGAIHPLRLLQSEEARAVPPWSEFQPRTVNTDQGPLQPVCHKVRRLMAKPTLKSRFAKIFASYFEAEIDIGYKFGT